jgi:hypothetical protein
MSLELVGLLNKGKNYFHVYTPYIHPEDDYF